MAPVTMPTGVAGSRCFEDDLLGLGQLFGPAPALWVVDHNHKIGLGRGIQPGFDRLPRA
jgi:hypothetical protein